MYRAQFRVRTQQALTALLYSEFVMFGIDFFNNIVRFFFLDFDSRIETLYRMSARMNKMNDQVIHVPENKKKEAYAEIAAYTRRFNRWRALHARLPW